MPQKLPRSFYARPTLRVARDLLGKHFVRRQGKAILVGKIVEVEAYLGERDPASHAYRGRTSRNEVMFGKPGRLYVYFTYGMHYCANIVTEAPGKAGAVLIRAVEPLSGTKRMAENRKRKTGKPSPPALLTRGPARFCQAFAIGRRENGSDLLGSSVYLTRGKPVRPSERGRSGRIGISKGRAYRWRFFLRNNRWVSKRA